MSELPGRQSLNLSAIGLQWRCAVLTGVMLAAFGIAGWVGFHCSGQVGLQAAAVAAGVCWISAMLALISTACFRDPRQVMFQLLFGMIFRMGIPFGTGLWLKSRGGFLAQAGVFGYIVALYLLALVVETLLALTYFQAAKPAGVVKHG